MMQNTETQTTYAETITNQCPTCTRNKYDPFRNYDQQGRIVAGCVDDFHSGHLVSPSASNSWHYSKEAKQIRATAAKHKRNIFQAVRLPDLCKESKLERKHKPRRLR